MVCVCAVPQSAAVLHLLFFIAACKLHTHCWSVDVLAPAFNNCVESCISHAQPDRTARPLTAKMGAAAAQQLYLQFAVSVACQLVCTLCSCLGGQREQRL
jgi:hypothetical protein